MKKSKGFVYLICDPQSDRFKIGMTKGTIEHRMKQLQTGNPNELFIKDYYHTDYVTKLEKMLHLKYRNDNVLNEWFDLQPNDVFAFRDTCKLLENKIINLKDNPFYR